MGFELAKSATLTFEGTEWEGAEIRVRMDLSLREFMEVQAATRRLSEGPAEEMIEAFREFGAAVLRSWNLERDGAPVPCTGEEFARLPMRMLNAIANVWHREMTEVPSPLPGSSANGALSVEQPAS